MLASTAVLGVTATPVLAEDIVNLSTGLDSANNVIMTGAQPDAHWNVDQPSGGQGPAQTVFPNNADWFHGTGPNDPAWLANGPDSNWVARDPNTSANGLGMYTRVFDLTGLDLSQVSITGAWAIDDRGTLSLNGHQIGELPNLRWDALTPFSVASGSPILNQGQNELTISITNTDNYLEAVRLEGAVSVVPEPSAAFMLVVGLIVLFGTARVYNATASNTCSIA
jgi:hypothetical protein